MEVSEREKVRAVLGNPVGFDISDAAAKARRLLLGFAIAMICLVGARLDPSDQVSIIGITLKGITANKLIFGLLVALFWSLLHYGWYAVENFLEWRLRLTGTKLAFQTGSSFSSEYADYPSDPKQSTLYYWWLSQAQQLESVEKFTLEATVALETLNSEIKSPRAIPAEWHPSTIFNPLFNNVQAAYAKLAKQLEKSAEVLSSARVPVSLERFDNSFKYLLRLQNMRVLVVDIVLPILLGFVGVWLGVMFLYKNIII